MVRIFDGFGDGDRNNDGAITSYDTDLNDSGTFNDPTADALLIGRGITEVTTAQDPADIGIIWSGIRSFDTSANLVKSKLRIINDSVPTGSETMSDIHNNGLALGVESRGGGSSFIGRFGQSIELGPVAGDKVIASFDWRVWREANDNTSMPLNSNELRWGLFQDTDSEFGQTAPYGDGWATSGGNGATVEWGKDDGKWFDSQPGAEGDKGIHTGVFFGPTAFTTDARIRWEHNQAGINGGSNNGRILEGNGVSDTPGAGGDTATIASPPGNGPGGIITDLSSYAPHKLSLEIVRLADGLVEVAAYVDGIEYLRDSIKTTDTGYNVLQPIPFSYDYVAIRNASNDWDYVIDNFMVEVIGSNAGFEGDFNNDGKVDAADYVVWRKTDGTMDGYNKWLANFGKPPGAGSSINSAAVPEPAGVALLLIAGSATSGIRRRRRCGSRLLRP